MIRSKIQQFMQGRYGNDQLNQGLAMLALILALINLVVDSALLYAISLLPIGFCFFRMLSRNYGARRQENVIFLKKARPAKTWVHTKKMMMTDKEHRYFKCPKCGQQLRVPRGRGNITVSCRSCGNRFHEKS